MRHRTFGRGFASRAPVMRAPRVLLHQFQSILPITRKSQADSLEWLAWAHAQAGDAPKEKMSQWASRFGCKTEQIAERYSVVPDFGTKSLEEMQIYNLQRNPRGAPTSARTEFFRKVASETFDRFYCEESTAPNSLLHVTCTGYDSPSAAERCVSRKGWGAETEIYHLYHMGCYAAIPAVRLAEGLEQRRVDIVHTELCSLHLNPSNHTPEQWVIQSLFSDGMIKYTAEQISDTRRVRGLEVLNTRKEVIPRSEGAMTWSVGDYGMEMTLSREVPELLTRHLYSFIERLSPRWNEKTIFAVHPGGPRIVDQVETLLHLQSVQTAASRRVLLERGNMSSATLPHIWKEIVEDDFIEDGAEIISLAFGPGLTLCGSTMRKRVP